MKYRFLFEAAALVAAAVSIGCSDAHPVAPATPVVVDGRIPVFAPAGSGPKSVVATGKGLDVFNDPAPPPRTRNRIEYHAGRIQPGVPNVYIIWYGSWPSSDPVRTNFQILFTNFVANLCGPYMQIVRAYPQQDGQVSSGCVFFAGASLDAFSHDATLSDADVADVLVNQFESGGLALDPSGIYLVMASPEIAESSGFGTSYCGWHGRTEWRTAAVRFAFIGWPERAPTNCAPNGVGPTGHASADAAASHFAALLADMVTDPYYDAWFDKLGLEIADKCVWTYGTTYPAANGKPANVHLGSGDYLLQQLWVPSKSGGACALHL